MFCFSFGHRVDSKKVGAAFSPVDISGLVFWGDPTNASKINAGSPSNGDPVSTLVDSSLVGNNATQGTGTKQPTWNTTHLTLDGGDCLNADGVKTSLAASATGEIIVRVKPTDSTPPATEAFFSFGDTNLSSSINCFIRTDGLIVIQASVNGVTKWNYRTPTALLTSGVWAELGLAHNGTSPTFRIDNSVITMDNIITTDPSWWIADDSNLDNFRLYCRNINSAGDDLFFTGDAQHSFVFSNTLSNEDRALINAYDQP